MAEIKCFQTDCWYCRDRMCTHPELDFIGDECTTYIDRCDPAVNPEYRCEFWSGCQTKRGVKFRVKQQGKRIVYNGFVFYTHDDDRFEQETYVTEERTGADCGRLARLKEKWDVFLAGIALLENVKDFPIGETLCRNKYIIDGKNVDESGERQ